MVATTYNITNHNVLDMLQGLEVTVYEKIKRFMDFTTLKAEVSLRRLAYECSLSKNTVLKYINNIVEKGLLYKKVEWDDKKNQYKTNQYYFIGELSYAQVVQKKKDLVQEKVQYKNSSLNDVIDPDTIKLELEEKYGQDIVEKALLQMKYAIERGTNVVHLKAYLNKVCEGIQAQQDMVKGISQVGKNKPYKSKSNGGQTVTNGWKVNSIRQSSKYSNGEIEDIIFKKRFEKYGF